MTQEDFIARYGDDWTRIENVLDAIAKNSDA